MTKLPFHFIGHKGISGQELILSAGLLLPALLSQDTPASEGPQAVAISGTLDGETHRREDSCSPLAGNHTSTV